MLRKIQAMEGYIICQIRKQEKMEKLSFDESTYYSTGYSKDIIFHQEFHECVMKE